MDAGMIGVLVVAAIFLGSIVWLEIHSRRQAAKKEASEASAREEQAPASETPAGQRPKKKR